MVGYDILNILDKIAPNNLNYKHLEGNAPAHIKASLIGSSVNVNFREWRNKNG